MFGRKALSGEAILRSEPYDFQRGEVNGKVQPLILINGAKI